MGVGEGQVFLLFFRIFQYGTKVTLQPYYRLLSVLLSTGWFQDTDLMERKLHKL